jgi:hypothetical protein
VLWAASPDKPKLHLDQASASLSQFSKSARSGNRRVKSRKAILRHRPPSIPRSVSSALGAAWLVLPSGRHEADAVALVLEDVVGLPAAVLALVLEGGQRRALHVHDRDVAREQVGGETSRNGRAIRGSSSPYDTTGRQGHHHVRVSQPRVVGHLKRDDVASGKQGRRNLEHRGSASDGQASNRTRQTDEPIGACMTDGVLAVGTASRVDEERAEPNAVPLPVAESWLGVCATAAGASTSTAPSASTTAAIFLIGHPFRPSPVPYALRGLHVQARRVKAGQARGREDSRA